MQLFTAFRLSLLSLLLATCANIALATSSDPDASASEEMHGHNSRKHFRAQPRGTCSDRDGLLEESSSSARQLTEECTVNRPLFKAIAQIMLANDTTHMKEYVHDAHAKLRNGSVAHRISSRFNTIMEKIQTAYVNGKDGRRVDSLLQNLKRVSSMHRFITKINNTVDALNDAYTSNGSGMDADKLAAELKHAANMNIDQFKSSMQEQSKGVEVAEKLCGIRQRLVQSIKEMNDTHRTETEYADILKILQEAKQVFDGVNIEARFDEYLKQLKALFEDSHPIKGLDRIMTSMRRTLQMNQMFKKLKTMLESVKSAHKTGDMKALESINGKLKEDMSCDSCKRLDRTKEALNSLRKCRKSLDDELYLDMAPHE